MTEQIPPHRFDRRTLLRMGAKLALGITPAGKALLCASTIGLTTLACEPLSEGQGAIPDQSVQVVPAAPLIPAAPLVPAATAIHAGNVLPTASNQGARTEVNSQPAVDPEINFTHTMENVFPPFSFYPGRQLRCEFKNGPDYAPSEAEALTWLKKNHCLPPIEPDPQLLRIPWESIKNDRTIAMLAATAIPVELTPIPFDDMVLAALFLAAAGSVMLSAFKSRKNSYSLAGTSHSDYRHDPKHPRGGPAREIINTIIAGGVERFCFGIKMLASPGVEISRTIVTIGVQGSPYLSHLAWFDTAWGGAYTIRIHPKDIAAIARTSNKILSVVAEACPSFPKASSVR